MLKRRKSYYTICYRETIVLSNRNYHAQKFLTKYPNPDHLSTVSDKLKWYRLHNNLLQSEVAEHIGVDRTTYSRYEENKISTYPIDKLILLAELFDTDIENLLDEYNRFLYNNQGEQIKKLRKSLGLTQSEFAVFLNVPLGTLKRWEQNISCIQRKTYIKLKNLL